jgi:hypothetical protein
MAAAGQQLRGGGRQCILTLALMYMLYLRNSSRSIIEDLILLKDQDQD